METNSLFEVWRRSSWETSKRLESYSRGRGLTRRRLRQRADGAVRTLRGILLSALPSCSSTLCEKRLLPQSNTHPLTPPSAENTGQGHPRWLLLSDLRQLDQNLLLSILSLRQVVQETLAQHYIHQPINRLHTRSSQLRNLTLATYFPHQPPRKEQIFISQSEEAWNQRA